MARLEEHPHPESTLIVPGDQDAPHLRSALAGQRIAALGEMTAGLAHDFRNILAIIESGLNLAERNCDDAEKAAAALAAAREGVRRGIRLTSRIVGFARPEKPDFHPESLNDLLTGLRTFLKYGAGPGIRIVLDLAPDLPACRIDPPEFNAAILNLVVNARDAMPDGGEIRIATDQFHQFVEGSGGPPRRCVRVRVVDQGCGMTPDVAQHLFDPYFTTKGDAGTGLGVPQVAAFMQSLGGTVSVSTEPGAGTTFDLLFPLSGHRDPADGNLSRQVDRWENEGGRPGRIEGPIGRREDTAGAVDRPNPSTSAFAFPQAAVSPAAQLPGTNQPAQHQ